MEDKIKRLLEVVPDFKYAYLTDEELFHIDLNKDLVKGLNANYKRYLELKKIVNPTNQTVFFDICHLLGYFSKGGLELDYTECIIEHLYFTTGEDKIKEFIKSIKQIKYSSKYSNILNDAIAKNDFKDNHLFYANIFNYFKIFSKHMEKINKNRIRTITNRNSSFENDEQKLKRLKENGRNITLEDVKDYRKKIELINKYDFLKPYFEIFILETYDSVELQNIIDLYLYAQENTACDEIYFKNIITPFNDQYKAIWLSSKDPFNLILGYMLRVCSTFSGTGSKIMIDGMLEPENKHIIILNEEDELEAKATAVFHDKYIFCGPLTFTDAITDNLTNQLEGDYYYKYLSTIKEQYDSLKQRGINVNEIRIATDEGTVMYALRGRENFKEFKELLSKCTYFWGEMDDKLFDHKQPQYKLTRGLK